MFELHALSRKDKEKEPFQKETIFQITELTLALYTHIDT